MEGFTTPPPPLFKQSTPPPRPFKKYRHRPCMSPLSFRSRRRRLFERERPTGSILSYDDWHPDREQRKRAFYRAKINDLWNHNPDDSSDAEQTAHILSNLGFLSEEDTDDEFEFEQASGGGGAGAGGGSAAGTAPSTPVKQIRRRR